jgi:hypothetical protein
MGTNKAALEAVRRENKHANFLTTVIDAQREARPSDGGLNSVP